MIVGGEIIVFRPRDFIIVAGTGNVKSTLGSSLFFCGGGGGVGVKFSLGCSPVY